MEDYIALVTWAKKANLEGISEDEIQNDLSFTDSIEKVRQQSS